MKDAVTAQQRAEELASRLPPLMVAAERVASTVAQGVHGRRRVGTGEAFWQFRQYEFGDSLQRIDWRQTGKRDRVYIRETEWEAAQSVWVWRDTSASMHYRSDPRLPEKADRADLLTLALMALLIRGGERVGLIGSGLPPAAGRSGLSRFAQAMLRRASDEAGLPPAAPLPRHSEVILLGDFLSPLPEIDRAVRAIAGRGIKGHMMQVLDPAEEDLPFTGRTRFEGLEAEGEALIPRVESVRAEYQNLLAAHVRGIADIARAVGWGFMSHRTDRSAQAALLELFVALSRPPEMVR
jgi:uncharacterized protein (DUF58 family)